MKGEAHRKSNLLMQDYRYVNCEEGTSQYDSIVFQKGEPVDAIYVPATLAVDRGNPLIEALPPFRSEGQIDAVYTRSLLGYDRDAVKSMSLYAKISQIRDLRRVRFPMLFHARLEQEFHSLLTAGSSICNYTSIIISFRILIYCKFAIHSYHFTYILLWRIHHIINFRINHS